MDNLAPDQERDAGVRSGLRGRARAEDLPPMATPISSCRSLAFEPYQPCLGISGFVARIQDITSSVTPEAWCKPAWWAGRDLFHTRGPHVREMFSEASWSPTLGTKSGGRVPRDQNRVVLGPSTPPIAPPTLDWSCSQACTLLRGWRGLCPTALGKAVLCPQWSPAVTHSHWSSSSHTTFSNLTWS